MGKNREQYNKGIRMIIIKVGGGESINIEGVCQDLKTLIEKDEKIILVHGANNLRDSLAEKLGTKKTTIKSLSGQESVFSDKEMIDLIMMSYSGLRNKIIVEHCQQKGVNAIGLSGLDARVISGERNKGIKTEKNGKVILLRDFSGKPKKINKKFLSMLLDEGYVPILTIPILDENGFAINSENDDIVALLQKEFQAKSIIQLVEAKGFLENQEDESSLIKNISRHELEKLETSVSGRMKRKIYSLKKIFQSTDSKIKVFISDGRTQNPILDALNGMGTTIQ